MSGVGLSLFQLSFELSPILLENGLAQNLPGGVMPIIALTEAAGTTGFAYDDYFAHFKVLPNSTLAEWQFAQYPFASLVMAANAAIQMPLKVSMIMTCPAQNDVLRNYYAKAYVMRNLQSQLQTHVLMGGTFIVNTPAYTYTDMLLLQLRDVTTSDTKQAQIIYQWDFFQPLVTQAAASQVLGTFNSKVEAGLPTPITWNSQ